MGRGLAAPLAHALHTDPLGRLWAPLSSQDRHEVGAARDRLLVPLLLQVVYITK
jgi:hypothetical protein